MGNKTTTFLNSVKDIPSDGIPGKEGKLTITGMNFDMESRVPMLQLLKLMADYVDTQFPRDNVAGKEEIVIVTKDQMKEAQAARSTRNSILRLTTNLRNVNAAGQDAAPDPAAPAVLEVPFMILGLAPVIAVIGAAITVLSLAESVSKIFRTDRRVGIDSVNGEAEVYLHLLLAKKGILDLTFDMNTIHAEAAKFLNSLGELQVALTAAGTRGDSTDRIEAGLWIDEFLEKDENAGATPRVENFVEHIKGLMIAAAVVGKRRLLLDVEANVIQTVKSSFLRSERLFAAGQVQINYLLYAARVVDASSNAPDADIPLRHAVYLLSSKPMLVELENSSRLHIDFTSGNPDPDIQLVYSRPRKAFIFGKAVDALEQL
jgi:hypothetical protein